jgi:hypothetical protein
MHMPGFSAEATLYKSTENYVTTNSSGMSLGGTAITPQQFSLFDVIRVPQPPFMMDPDFICEGQRRQCVDQWCESNYFLCQRLGGVDCRGEYKECAYEDGYCDDQKKICLARLRSQNRRWRINRNFGGVDLDGRRMDDA